MQHAMWLGRLRALGRRLHRTAHALLRTTSLARAAGDRAGGGGGRCAVGER